MRERMRRGEERARLLREWRRNRPGKRKRIWNGGVGRQEGEIGHKKLEEKLR